MNVIKVLPQDVASQIAAGEVIDRPASVVRELIDNSIDAGSDRISIQIGRGGRSLIKVADRGVGMSGEDLALCVERHATSKITAAEDLFAIKTLGFRGEALPSIASVARVRITSRPHHEVAAHQLEVEGGKRISLIEAGSPPGTMVEVRDLFFNLPARRKFLRAERTETSHIVDTVTRIAAAYPEIGFHLEEDGRELLNLPASERYVARMAALLGRDAAEAMRDLESEWGGFKVRVYAAPPEFGRKRPDRLYVYVNRRHVKDRLITRAVMEGYGQRLMRGQYPQVVLFIDILSGEVDVNVHPTKQEVRFRNSQAVFRAVLTTVEKCLAGLLQVSSSERTPPGEHHLGGPSQAQMPFAAEPAAFYREEGGPPLEWTFVPGPRKEPEEGPAAGPLTVIGQLGRSYILCETPEGLLMVDQHAAHERILYEQLKEGIRRGRLPTQANLFPAELELSARETRVALEHRGALEEAGFELDHFGGNTFLLRAVPAVLKDGDWHKLVPGLLALLEEGRSLEGDLLLDRMLITMACHGAIKAGDRLGPEEMAQLVGRLAGLELPDNCPHGRPVYKRFRYGELEKMFKRVT